MFSSLKLRSKILVALIGLSVLPLAAALILLSAFTDEQMEQGMQLRADETVRFVKERIDAAQREVSNYIRLSSLDSDLSNSIYFSENPEEMLNLKTAVEDAQEIFHIDLIQVLNPEGHVLRRTLREGHRDLQPTTGKEHPVIQAALAGTDASGLGSFDGRAAIVAVSPISYHQKVIGYLLGAIFLDDIAEHLRQLGGTAVAFYNPEGEITTSDAELTELSLAQIQGRESWTQQLGKTPYSLYNIPFGGRDEGLIIAYDRSELVEARRNLRAVLLTILLGVGTLAVLIGVAISRGVVRPLTEVVKNLKEIAEGEADLTRALKVRSRDEVGELAESFNRFLGRLAETVRRIKVVRSDLAQAAEKIRLSSSEVNMGALRQSQALEESHQAIQGIDQTLAGVAESTSQLLDAAEGSSSATLELGSTIEEIADQMEKLFATVEEVSSSITQMSVASQQVTDNIEALSSSTEITASSITEMDAAIKEIEENAGRTSALSEAAARDAQSGKEAVDETIQGICAVREIVDGATTVIQDLGAQSSAIGKILTVIDEVADQTSLLALNAAIIAAQAGEHGRGFAVVADEIRELADRTAVSTREIAAIITRLQDGTRGAVKAMGSASERVHKEVDRSRIAGSALDQIRNSTLTATEQVRSIVRATQEQARGSQQITQSINQVAAMLNQIATAVNQQSEGTQQLAKAAEFMKDIASRVNLSTGEQTNGSRQINLSMENIRDMIERIDAASREQALRSRQVVEAVSSVRSIAENNVARTAELDQVVELLAEQTGTLENEVGAFKA
ncbi:hypothetical protein DESUT3_04730 [Desulfuromonas versatilis]|uniref:Methyl-accepting chemotaxis sensory transducer n=1 Tax=Desulfuromonas versatilis TaxID=2802975 RepID=A0ABM8HPA2_9BACT|nr:methyl-accepting chemotaxis protein [Desulfuromonas versatilis]BCR03404.1 hypothetical protein DESUT3_04730 [Desulfuromonas versatilis]